VRALFISAITQSDALLESTLGIAGPIRLALAPVERRHGQLRIADLPGYVMARQWLMRVSRARSVAARSAST
jgi:hypothetical protein